MSHGTDDLDDKLRALPAMEPPTDVSARALRIAAGRPHAARPLPIAPRIVLFLTVLCYLGWAFRAASLLGQ